MCEVSGARYAAMVLLAGLAGSRPQETIAIRLSWVILDGPRAGITLHGAAVKVRREAGTREWIQAPLKHRQPGDVRFISFADHPGLGDAIRTHIADHVPAPDPDATDEDVCDPLLFTTHTGAQIDLGNFTKNWWRPITTAMFTASNDEQFAAFPFRLLRASAITSWLHQGHTLAQCAQRAGNSQGVIEKHYAGVLTEIGYTAAAPASADNVDIAQLSTAELADIQKRVTAALVDRSTG